MKICAFFIISMHLVAGSELVGWAVVPDYATLCPSRDFCTSNATNRPSDSGTSCCQRCSCEESCFSYGTCCPDIGKLYPNAVSNGTRDFRCSSTRQVIDAVRNKTQRYYYGTKYRVVNSCPNATISETFPGCLRPSVFRDFVFVSDLENINVVYMNKQCAACNGAVKTVDWLLHVESCEGNANQIYENPDNIFDFIFQYCELEAWPPFSIDVGAAVCYTDNIISECNVTERWNVYDPDIEDACLMQTSFQNTAFISPVHHGFAFANVYCHLCNIDIDELLDAKLVCKRRVFEVFREQLVRFSALIDIKEMGREEEQSRCLSTHVWDRFVRECRPLHCPLGNKPINGKCVNQVVIAYGFAVQFYFEIQSNPSDMAQYHNNIDTLRRLILQELEEVCGFCVTTFYHKTNTTIYYLKTEVFTTEKCSLEMILNLIRESYKNGVVKGNITYTFSKPSNLLDYQVHESKFHVCVYSLSLKPKHLQLCPHFIISNSEFISLDFTNGLTEMEGSMDIVHDEETDTVGICTRAYFKHMENTSAQVAQCSVKVTLAVVLLINQFLVLI